MSAAMISISDLTKNYGTTKALAGISFEVPRGQVVGFLGPNGAGKSTTMKILTGFVEPTAGRVRVNGIDIQENSVLARKHIGYLPENNPVYEDMMVYEYLEYLARIRKLDPKSTAAQIQKTIDRCGLNPVRHKNIGELSKGFRQRVGLAQAILHDPDLLILDEPTTGLDPNQVVEIRELIKEIGEEKTVLMSTHVMSEVQATCSRVLIISDGLIVADDSPEKLTAEGGSVRITVAPKNGAPLNQDNVREVLTQVTGVTDVFDQPSQEEDTITFELKYGADDPRRALFDAVVKNNYILMGLENHHISLEDTFRKLTT